MLSISKKALCGTELLFQNVSAFQVLSARKSLNWNKGLTRWNVCGNISCDSVTSFASAAKSPTFPIPTSIRMILEGFSFS